MGVHLNFINHSNDISNSEVVIFQKNVATDFDELAVAWKVIRYCGRGDHHPFIFPLETKISARDSYGNHTPHLPAKKGQLFHMILGESGNMLSYKGPATTCKEVQIQNDLQKGAIAASIYKDSKLLARKTAIVPGQKAVFEFKPTLFIGVASQILEGQMMNSAVISSINTEFSLLGVASADIVMTGGGGGPRSTAFTFNLDNVVPA